MVWIFLIIAAAAFIVILWIVARHLAALRILNVESLPETREKRVKSALLSERLMRMGRDRAKALTERLRPVRAATSKMGSRFRERVQELEVAYEQAKRIALGTRGKRTAQIVGLLRQAGDLERQGKPEEAERKYIAVISLDPRSVDAYEGLGNLYLAMKKYDEAREALNFLTKFRPNDASVIVSLGEVALAEGKPALALPYFARAVELRPSNPKYLDFLIEAAILAGNRSEAERGLAKIRETNPENQKISEWEKKIESL